MDIKVIKSKNHDVFTNIALEFSMFKEVERKFKEDKISSALLFLWQNYNTVVLGRNQNVYKECNLEFCNENNITISRRYTGGGAVFHDRGNLNYTFISSSDIYDLKLNYKIIQNALYNFGIQTELSGRNDLTAKDHKFSGNAFYNSQFASMHHGTLLIDTNHELVSKALTPDIKKLTSKGVDSVRSRIINLVEINEMVNAENLSYEIVSEFENIYAVQEINYSPKFSQEVFENCLKQLQSSAWIFNNNSKSEIELENRFDWGNITIKFDLNGEQIKNLEVYSDMLFTDIPLNLKKMLLFQSLKEDNIRQIFKSLLNTTTNAKKNKIYLDVYSLMQKILN